MSSLPFPQGFVYRHLSPARDGQTLPLLYLTKWKESVCHPARAESWDPEFPFAPPSSALSPPSCHISLLWICFYTPAWALSFFSGIFCCFQNGRHRAVLWSDPSACVISLWTLKDRCNANAFKHQLPLLRILKQMKKQLLLYFHPFSVLSPNLHTDLYQDTLI